MSGKNGDQHQPRSRANDTDALQVSLVVSSLLSIAAVIGIWFLIHAFIHASIDSAAIGRLFIWPVKPFAPEPAERLQYIAGAVAFPLLVFGLAGPLWRLFGGFANRIDMRGLRNWLFVFVFIICAVLLWFDNAASGFFYLKQGLFYGRPLLFIAIFFIALFAAFRFRQPQPVANSEQSRTRFLVDIAAVAMIAAIALTSFFSASALDNGFTYFTSHFNAVLYAVSQVAGGKTLLVDLTNQYGFYPQFLQPIFAVTGLSVIKFTFLMSLITSLGMLCLYVFIRRIVADSWISFLGFSAVVYYGYFIIRPMANFDPVFQYYPIRFIFPALLIPLAYQYFKKQSKTLYWLITVLAAVSVLWNFDTGLIVFVTWLLALAYAELLGGDFKQAFRKTLVHIGIGFSVLLVSAGVLLLYLAVRSAHVPDVGALFQYQRTFISYGFGMTPMRAIDPWNAVILIYAAGLAYSIKALLKKRGSAKDKAVFLLSVLGIGLFSYYQGASIEWNLAAVWYPSILLIVIAADGALANLKRENRETYPNLALLGVTFLILSTGLPSFVYSYSEAYRVIINRAANRSTTSVTEGIDYISRNTAPGEGALILSYNAAAYYAESGTVNSLKGPGFSELFFRSDYNRLILALERRQVDKVFLDTSFLLINPSLYAMDPAVNESIAKTVINNYIAIGRSPSGNIVLYKRSRAAKPPVSKGNLLPPSASTFYHLKFDPAKGVFVDNGKIFFPRTKLGKRGAGPMTIEAVITPQIRQTLDSVMIDSVLFEEPYRGIRLQQSGPASNSYNILVGDGVRWNRIDGIWLKPEQRHYLVLIIDRNSLSLFNNGDLAASLLMQRPFKNSGGFLTIGPFNGDYEELRISERAFSVTEVRQNADLLRKSSVLR